MSATLRNATIFIGLVLGLSALVSLAAPLIGEASLFVIMFTPAIAMMVLVTVISPEGGIRGTLEKLGLTSAGLKAWPVAILVPAAIFLCGTALLVAVGLTELRPGDGGVDLGRLAFKFVIGLVVTTLLAACEEVSWRGYLLPEMMPIGAVRAMLIVGFIQGLWHMPLLLTTSYYHSSGEPWIIAPMVLATLTLAGVFFGYLRIWTGSVWPAAIAHASVNSVWNVTSEVTDVNSSLVMEYLGGESGAIMIVALIFIDIAIIRMIRSGGVAVPVQP